MDMMTLGAAMALCQKKIDGAIKGDFAMEPGVLQKIAASGDAKKYFEIGDLIYIPWTNFTGNTPVAMELPFVVVHIGDCYDDHDTLHKDAIWLMLEQAEPEEIVFDEPERITATGKFIDGLHYFIKDGDNYVEQNVTAGDDIPSSPVYYVHSIGGTNGGNILRYGYNNYKKSAYRQWLNSDAAKNANWWTAQHDYDVSPTSTYTNKPGWLFGFTQEWKDIFKPVKVQVASNTVTDGGLTDVMYDKFFLPSVEQMYGSPQAAGIEGDYWEYWKNKTGFDAPKNGSSSDASDARKIPNIQSGTTSAVYCRLRSAGRGLASDTWYVSAGGCLSYYYYAHYAFRCQPACVIY